MATVTKWITTLPAILSRCGPCCAAGVLAGLVAGLLLVLVFCAGTQSPLAPGPVVEIGLVVALPGFLMTAWGLVVLEGLPASRALPPLLANAAFTGLATTALASQLGLWGFAPWIGMLAGAVAGRLLCLLGICPDEVTRGLR